MAQVPPKQIVVALLLARPRRNPLSRDSTRFLSRCSTWNISKARPVVVPTALRSGLLPKPNKRGSPTLTLEKVLRTLRTPAPKVSRLAFRFRGVTFFALLKWGQSPSRYKHFSAKNIRASSPICKKRLFYFLAQMRMVLIRRPSLNASAPAKLLLDESKIHPQKNARQPEPPKAIPTRLD